VLRGLSFDRAIGFDAGLDEREIVRMWIGKRTKQDGVDDAENGDVERECDSQRRDRGDSEAG